MGAFCQMVSQGISILILKKNPIENKGWKWFDAQVYVAIHPTKQKYGL